MCLKKKIPYNISSSVWAKLSELGRALKVLICHRMQSPFGLAAIYSAAGPSKHAPAQATRTAKRYRLPPPALTVGVDKQHGLKGTFQEKLLVYCKKIKLLYCKQNRILTSKILKCEVLILNLAVQRRFLVLELRGQIQFFYTRQTQRYQDIKWPYFTGKCLRTDPVHWQIGANLGFTNHGFETREIEVYYSRSIRTRVLIQVGPKQRYLIPPLFRDLHC